jgi:DNA mismatch endonuclease, patch repair protein
MTDIVDQATRSRMMASIRAKHTKPENNVRRFLHAAGLRFRLHDRSLPGSPDLVLPKYRVAIFVNGCFWHRHQGCRFATNPATRQEFWEAKFSANLRRDKAKTEELTAAGWRVLTIWECETREEVALDKLFWRIVGGS